jgi:hypothetical protein
MRTNVLIGAAVVLLVAVGAAQERPQPALPPVVMTCPTHPEIVEARSGQCPICRRTLVPVRLEGAWMCPVHTTIMEPGRGSCRLCRRDLIRVTVSLTWTCRGDSREHLEPDTCADGSARIARRTLRPHGNHNPRHGGQFFMAPDNWHHLEGTYPRDRTFRLYIYDDYSRPLSRADLRQVEGRVVTQETFDAATRITTEVETFPLRASRNGAYLEARIGPARLPLELAAKIRLQRGAPEYRFDFTFAAITREPAAAAPAAANAAAPAATRPGASTPLEPGPLDVLPIPTAMDAILRHLDMRTRHVRTLIDEGNLQAVYVPAFQAKDLAVALEPHLAHLAPVRRDDAGPALAAVVRTAWLLDAFGDVGNRRQVTQAYEEFSAAVAAVITAFEGAQP